MACAAVLATTGCRNVPGRPGPNSAVPRPEDVTDFKTLYSENCAACHGVEGRHGAAISLANPVYLATNASNLQVTMEFWPSVGFHATREHGQRLAQAR